MPEEIFSKRFPLETAGPSGNSAEKQLCPEKLKTGKT
jgi:hypothetical protein